MDDKTKWKKLSKNIPRILRASLIAIALYFLLFYLPTLVIPSLIPVEYEPLIDIFAVMVIFFAFITQMASGTIFRYVFGVARALAFIIFFTLVLGSGATTGNFEGVFILVDLRVFFAMLIGIELLEFGKSLVESINFLSEKTNLWTPTGTES